MKTEPGAGFFDRLEQRPPAEREQAQFAQARALLARLQVHTAYGQEQLAGFDAAALQGRADLARLPVLRKADIAARQAALRPFGGLTLPDAAPRKVFQSPGPIYEPEGHGPDPWRLARALFAAGFRAGDVVHNSFSYHLTPAGSMLEGGALALGCSVLPAGVGQTELQLQAARELGCNAYTGTPSFLRILLERAGDAPLGLRKALVSGEAFPPGLQDWVAARGVQAYQCYATADCGLIAYETPARSGLVVDEGVIVEIVRPGSGEPVAEGEVGEVVVTRLDAAYPLIRYATGDLSAFLPGPSPCGRSNRRLRGWLGRADQSAKVRGLFVHAGQVQQLRERFPELTGRMRWVIEGQDAQDRFTVLLEAAEPADGWAERLLQAVRDITKLRAELRCVRELPNDGRLIDDRR
ncbi:phenylacetate--CoA ligase family protein [Inhella proteolytica]|uniref:AMP-binding protein n=1 Tax=Inhella proteolytica TaxID=2795029 RepID=A0A931J103_9BURK|nr:AMP-binding protein [Inhella proteolytica]MBH9577524.1 AMP-binding protein [Inhella proteolytica]